MSRSICTSISGIALVLVLSQATLFSSLRSCVWCTDQEIPALAQFSDDSRADNALSPLLSTIHDSQPQLSSGSARLPGADTSLTVIPGAVPEQNPDKQSAEQLPAFFVSACRNQQNRVYPDNTSRFYREYLALYFPRIDAIVDILFPTMCHHALSRALADLTHLIHDREWYYFVNNQEDLTLCRVHVEILLSQMTRLVIFLEKAEINFLTGLVVESEGRIANRRKSLITRLKKEGILNFYETYALHFDYLVRCCYLAVRFLDMLEASSYRDQMRRRLKHIAGSRYEQKYTQITELYRQLLLLLKKRKRGE